MTSWLARLGHFVLWLVVTVMVLLALTVTALRVSLPRLNNYQSEIETWVAQTTGVPFSIGNVKGYWRNTHPSISLQNLEVQNISDKNVTFVVEEVQLQMDLIQSILTLSPQIASLNVNGLYLDISQIKLIGNDPSSEPNQIDSNSTLLTQLGDLFFRQLEDFNLQSATVIYQTFQGDVRTLNFDQLKWQNRESLHQLEGNVSLVGSHNNSLEIKANFKDNGSLFDITGDFYTQARNIGITPWLTKFLEDETGIEGGQVSFNSWFSFDRSKPVDAYIELLPSELTWTEGSSHALLVEKGFLKLLPVETSDTQKSDSWKVSGHSIMVRTDELEWPSLDLVFQWQPDQWTANISQLDIQPLRPLAHLLPDSSSVSDWLNRLQPSGLIEDIRIAQSNDTGELSYSASLSSGGMKQWELLPEVHDLSADIAGTESIMRANVTLIDDVLPYGDVFQAPLRIKQGEVDIVWQSDENGWRLWSDKVTAATPDLQVLGEFMLDFPKQGSPFLSFYAEADAFNVGETWRYLPTLALGQDLTDYLSTAIQGGEAKTVQIMWYGVLNEFPYKENNGIFQAKVGLKNTQFSFDTRWPTITDMQLNLLFENESMYMDSRYAKLMDVEADLVTGKIAYLGPGGAVEIKAMATAKGRSVRDYMMATPLVDSVGAALTTIQVNGNVKSEFQLNIPFDSKQEPRAWGYADLIDNHIEIQSPPMQLEKARGRITFDNDVVKASGLSANLLSQPIALDFKGESLGANYAVDIDLLGDWDLPPLAPYVGEKWIKRVQGHAPWIMSIDLQLNDVGFTYQIDSTANLEFVSSQYPAPLAKALGEKRQVQLQASGNQETISGRIQMPGVKYQAEIDITGNKPVLYATNLLVGKGGFKVSPIVGHHLAIRSKTFNLDDWLEFSAEKKTTKVKSKLSEMKTPDIPTPQKISIETDVLTLAALDWNKVNFSARKKNLFWIMKVDSAEVQGQANYLEPYDLSVALDRLQIFIPELDTESEDRPVFKADEQQTLVTPFDRAFHRLMPNLTLNIQDFWLQGYKVGEVNIDLQRTEKQLNWRNIEFTSGNSKIKADGWWELDGDKSQSDFSVYIKGKNNTELMERFGISSGIQKAPFELTSKLNWQGAPWSMQVDTLQGDLSTEFGKGIISDVSGAAKLLGLFSLDSIIRRMQLDFSDVFDKGLAFNSITGTGKINRGIFVTNNIEMDAIAGDMIIRGMADLENRTVDAEVEFTPDLTSGIPVLTAFAVAPQAAAVVFAISTVISPVVDVFTRIRYQVKGPLDAPEVKELSRSKGEYKLPEK